MSTKNMPWLLLGFTAIIVVITITVVGAFIGLRAFGVGDASLDLSTPTSDGLDDAGTAQINGVLWHDLCASGLEGQQVTSSTPNGCIPTSGSFLANGQREAGEPGIQGVLVRLGEGACPAVGFAETTTAADGSFRFQSLAAGQYCVSVDPSLGINASIMLPGSWSAPVGSPQAMRNVTVSEGQAVDGSNFGWDYQYLPVPPTVTATVTSTATPTSTPTQTPTAVPVVPCDWIGFVKDVTAPDGTVYGPDEDFRKTWRLKNKGTCTWSKDYDLVYVSGDRMTGDNVTALKTAVKPGETIDLSIELTAPLEVGKHTGYWALRNAEGVIFGMGPEADEAFWVTVRVEKRKQLKLSYDLAPEYCAASWVSAAGSINCPTEEYDVSGFVQLQDAPVMEGGRAENEPGLWVIPEGVTNGYLSGRFPPFKIESGDRFRTVIACLEDNQACDVEFRLEYRIGDGDTKTLGKWREAYEGKYTIVDLDLTPLAGKDVQFILTIRALDEYNQDSGLWLRPSIWR